MPGLSRREARGQPTDVASQFDQTSEAPMVPFWPPPFVHWRDTRGLIHVEEYREDGTLVIRADLPGIDPDKDLELTISDGMLHIKAERREEEKRADKSYRRHELLYGPLSRSLPLPAGVTGDDITGTYNAGVLEIRVPEPVRARKIAITKS